MTRIVSVTPLSVAADSRAFKEAASMTRLGYESLVVEGRAGSRDQNETPFELVAPRGASGSSAKTGAAVPGAAGPPPVRGSLAARLFGEQPSSWRRALRLPFVAALYPLAFLKFAWDSARHLPHASLYYLHSFEQFPAVYLQARRHGVPYVYDAHDLYFVLSAERRTNHLEERVKHRFRAAVERFCARHASAVVTVSDGVARVQEGEFGRRPAVIRNCHDLRLDEEVEHDLREEIGVPDDTFLLVVVGNAKRGMAVREAARAIAMLPPEVHLAFVGAGYEQFRAELEDRGRIHVVDPVSPTRITAFIRSADLAPIIYFPLTANHANALPNGFFHVVAAGLPMLYPPLPEMAALAKEHDLGLEIDPLDPDSIAAQVELLLEDRERLTHYRRSALAAREVLNWEHEEAKLGRIVTDALAAGERG